MDQTLKMNRVDSVDALRGFAVVAIMLLHFIEHFIYGVYPEATSETKNRKTIRDTSTKRFVMA